MAYYTRAQLVTKLTAVETAIAAAQTAEDYGIGNRRKRMNLDALYKERDKLVEQIEMTDRRTTGFGNKVKFVRPV